MNRYSKGIVDIIRHMLVVLTDISNIYGKKLRDLLFLRGYVSIVSDAEHNTIEYTYKHSLQETNTQGSTVDRFLMSNFQNDHNEQVFQRNC
jgi:hypothetical protein